jgi:hypothetical protein
MHTVTTWTQAAMTAANPTAAVAAAVPGTQAAHMPWTTAAAAAGADPSRTTYLVPLPAAVTTALWGYCSVPWGPLC